MKPTALHDIRDRPCVALVSARAARNLDEDLLPLEHALRNERVDVGVVDWDDPSVDWGAFDIALLRSTWDYTTRLEAFLAWCHDVAQRTRLINPEPVVRWNVDKHYLRDLGQAAVPIIPSQFVEPGEAPWPVIQRVLSRSDAAEIVVKPAIGAGSRDARRHPRSDTQAMRAHVQRLIDAGRSALLQPYLGSVDEHGETALLFYAGEFSHAIRKGPMLRPSVCVEGGLFIQEHITPRSPTGEELRTARLALAAIPFGMPLYARVDLLRNGHGDPVVLELELTEPSMFFAHAPHGAERFATAISTVCFERGQGSRVR